MWEICRGKIVLIYMRLLYNHHLLQPEADNDKIVFGIDTYKKKEISCITI